MSQELGDEQATKRQRLDTEELGPVVSLSYYGSSTEFLEWLRLLKTLLISDCELQFHPDFIRADCRDGQDGVYFYVTQLNKKAFYNYQVDTTRMSDKKSHNIILRIGILFAMLSEVRAIDRVLIQTNNDQENLDITIYAPAVFRKDPKTGEEIQTEFQMQRSWRVHLINVELQHLTPQVRDYQGQITIRAEVLFNLLQQVRRSGQHVHMTLSEGELRFKSTEDAGDSDFRIQQFTDDQKAQDLALMVHREQEGDNRPVELEINFDYTLKTLPLQKLAQKITMMISENPSATENSYGLLHIVAIFSEGLGVFKFWQASELNW